ncbi:MAG: GNAT family N-acetyltransferase [Bacteroidales bacterium]|nr:GNAT family N-acetyltransferase [Bacteroidales bacterium]MDD3664281.1 GNAT family N-acetyltransferase [Bacteroidales bacterium]
MESHHIEFTTNSSEFDLQMIADYLSTKSYWAKGRTLDTIKRSIEGSLSFGILKNGKQIGFARVITDTATYYYLCDLFIIAEECGKGYGKQLTHYIVTHPDLKGCRGALLTADAHGLYSQYGFEADPEIATKYMTRKAENI